MVVCAQELQLVVRRWTGSPVVSRLGGTTMVYAYDPLNDEKICSEDRVCQQYEENTCNRGGFCNFMHLKRISSGLRRQLFGSSHHRHIRSRRRSPYRHHSHEERSRRNGRRHDDRDYHHESRSKKRISNSPDRRRGRSRSRSLGHKR